LSSLDAIAETGHPVDLAQVMMDLTLRIVARVLLGSSVPADITQIGADVGQMNAFAMEAITSPVPIARLPLARTREFLNAGRRLDRIVETIIREHRATPEATDSLLSAMMRATESGTGMDDRQLRDEVMTMFLAGHETTATVLSWMLYCLSTHPQCERELRAELDGRLDRPANMTQLCELSYAKQVLDETMRLFPPVWAISRRTVADDVITGWHIPAGTTVFVAPYLTHRHPELWPDPEAFVPERFAEESARQRPRYAYFPFSGGPRQCIGIGFAELEALLVLSRLMQRFEFRAVPCQRVEMAAMITLRPRYGIWATVHRRAS